MPCLVPTCPTSPGPSGFCRFHKNRLNARSSAYAEYMTDADRIAIAAHPGWRGRKWQLNAIMWADGLHYHASPDHGVGPGYKTAAEALAEVDRRNGLTPAADVARLEAELAAIRAHRDGLEDRRRELAADNDLLHLQVDTARWAHADLLVDIIGLRDEIAATREALDKQAATVAGLRSELAERERDITDLCAERGAYAADLETARQFAASDAAIIDNLRTGLRLLTDELTLARRPWWARLWAWVTGGGE